MAIRFINAFHEDDANHVGNRLRAVSTIETLQGVADMAGIPLEEIPAAVQALKKAWPAELLARACAHRGA